MPIILQIFSKIKIELQNKFIFKFRNQLKMKIKKKLERYTSSHEQK